MNDNKLKEKTLKVEAPKLTDWAIGTFKDATTGEWKVARFKFDPVSGQTGEFSTEVAGDGSFKDFAREKFRIAAVELDIV